MGGRGAAGGLGGRKLPTMSRRRTERYAVPQGRLIVFPEAIWPIIDISLTGLRVRVGRNFVVGPTPIYVTLRWGHTVLRTKVKLAWHSGDDAGLVICDTTGESLMRLRRLIEPLALGSSLSLIDSSATLGSESGKKWFHGQEDANLWVWQSPNTKTLHKWILHHGHHIYTWTDAKGLELRAYAPMGYTPMTPGEAVAVPVKTQLPWLRDLLWSLPSAVRHDLLRTLN